MCKLSLNIVPNVYNRLQSSFLSLAWPWPGRSFPKGNQWQRWYAQQGLLPGLGGVGCSPRGTSGSAGTLDWGPMWSGFQSTCHPNALLTPLHFLMPQLPTRPLYPCWPLIPTLPASPNASLTCFTPPDSLLMPQQPPMPPEALTP